LASAKICVAVCTRGDSEQLRDLLGYLRNQQEEFPAGQVRIFLVVNSKDAPSGEFLSFLLNLSSDSKVNFTHEPIRGIPFARNNALNHAIKNQIEWLAFIDDDCVPDPNWLRNLFLETTKQKLDAVMGGATIHPKGKKSIWLPNQVFGWKKFSAAGVEFSTGDIVPTAITRSILFDVSTSSIVQLNSLTFNEQLFESGGSDMEFFYRLSQLGGKLLYTEASQVREYYEGERLTLRWHFFRKLRYGQNHAERKDVDGKAVATTFFRVSRGGFSSKTIFEIIGMIILKLGPVIGLMIFPIYKHKEYRVKD
jgi:succinoglycan biosynthesis protein ExoM